MMGFGKPKPGHPGEIPVKVFAELTPDYFELARFWVSLEKMRSYCLVGSTEQWRPELFGSLLVECVETAAAAYAAHTNMPAAEAARLIWQGFDEERNRLELGRPGEN